MINQESNVDVVECSKAESVEYIDLWIPLVRYADGNCWGTSQPRASKEEAIAYIRGTRGMADAKILHHVERFVFDKK